MKKITRLLSFLFCFSFWSCASAQNGIPQAVQTDPIAERMLVYQLSNGGWAKQYADGTAVRYEDEIDETLLAKIRKIEPIKAGIDNSATTLEINTLIKAYHQTQNKAYLRSAEKGINYLLKAQYENGGWPQFYPDNSSYRAQVTFNDNASVNVLNIMQNIATQSNGFEAVNQNLVPKAEDAVKRGLDCILKTQFKQNGRLSIWAAQYDQHTLQPAKARNFEPAALATKESVDIVRFLMRFKNPSPEIKNAIKNAIEWFQTAKIEGFKFDKISEAAGRGLIADPTATIWSRFYDLETNKPIFGDRDNTIKSNVEEISLERRNSYGWYGNWAVNLLAKDYPKWLKSMGE